MAAVLWRGGVKRGNGGDGGRSAVRQVVHVDVDNMSHGRFPIDVDVFDRVQCVSGVRIEEQRFLLVVLLGEGAVEGAGCRLQLFVGFPALPDHGQYAEDQTGAQGRGKASEGRKDASRELHQSAAALLLALVEPGRAVGMSCQLEGRQFGRNEFQNH